MFDLLRQTGRSTSTPNSRSFPNLNGYRIYIRGYIKNWSSIEFRLLTAKSVIGQFVHQVGWERVKRGCR